MNPFRKWAAPAMLASLAATTIGVLACDPGQNSCYWPNGNTAGCVNPPDACCVKCGGSAGEAGYQPITVGGSTQYCKMIVYNPNNYPIWQSGGTWGSGRYIHSPCD